MKRYACAGIACLVLLASGADAADRRIALVIGNSAYKQEPLVNPGNDARVMAQALRDSGFTVLERRNLNQAALRRAIRDFGDEIAKGGVGLFYYAGHGMQIKGRNYLIPVGHDIQREDEVAEQSVDVGLVLEKLATAKNRLNILILDACRNNPFGGPGGLAPIDAPAGTLVAFSTAPGQVAADGTGDNSTYSKYLAQNMQQAGLRIEDVFKRTRSAVRQESGGKQVPWENTSLETDFYFRAPDARVLAAEKGERDQAQKEAIELAVQEVLKRRKELDGQDRSAIEREIAKRVAAERLAAERAAAERIAAIERAAQAAIERAMRGQQLASVQPVAAAPARESAPAPKPSQAPQPAAASREPVRVATAPASVSRGMQRAAIPFQAGDTWQYLFTERDYGNKKEGKSRQTVESVTDGEIRIRTAAGNLLLYNRDGNLVRRENKGGEIRTWEPFLPRFQFPLEPGKVWEQKFTFRRPGREVENDATVTVVGWEDVTVPAGVFTALKIAYVAWYRRTDNNFTGRTAVNVWYVPEVKRWVKMDVLDRGNNGTIYTDTSEELIAFKVK